MVAQLPLHELAWTDPPGKATGIMNLTWESNLRANGTGFSWGIWIWQRCGRFGLLNWS